MIKPTIGRIVWYYGGAAEEQQAEAAIVCYVHGNRLVNLSVHDQAGNVRSQMSVTLVQEEDPPATGQHARWMPFQITQSTQLQKEQDSQKVN